MTSSDSTLKGFAYKAYNAVILTGKDNYPVWSFTMKEHLTTAGMIEHIKPGNIKKEDTEKAQESKSLLLSSMASSEIEKILHCKTAAEIWCHFEVAYGAKTEHVRLELMTELNSLKCSNAK